MSGSQTQGGKEGSPRKLTPGLGGTIRAQSETLGILVIVGVVLVLAAAMAVFLLTDTGTEEEPRLSNVEIDATVDVISVRHEGGDRLNSEDIEVIVVTEGDRSEVNLLNDFSYRQPTVANEFQAGDEFARADGPYVGDVTVLVVHEPTETIIADEEFSIEPDMIVRINSISSANSGGSSLSTASEDSALTTDTETDLSVGDDVNVTFSIENKDVSDTFDLTVEFNNNVVNNTNVALDAGDNKTMSVTGSADLAGGLEVEVDAGYGLGYEPLAGPNFDVDFSYSLNSSSANVNYSVTNTGDIGHSQPLEIKSKSSGGTKIAGATESVSLGGGDSDSGTFKNIGVQANGELVLSSGNDTVTKEVSGGEFDVTGLDSSDISFNPPDGGDEVWAGDNVTVDYKVENVAEIADSTEVALEVNGSVATTTTTPVVPSGDTATGTLEATVPRDIAPFAQLTISTADDGSASGVDVYLPDPPNFEVDIDVPEPANDAIFYEEEDQQVNVSVTINNTGEVNDTQDIELKTGFGNYSTPIKLSRGVGGGEDKTRTFEFTPESGDAGEYTFSVSSNNDTDSADAQVFEELPDLIASLEDAEGSVGETVDVGLDVVELGASVSDIGSYSFALSFNGSVANITEIKGGEMGEPSVSNINNSSGAASTAAFSVSGTPPFEPGLTLGIEVLDGGTSAIEFNDSVDLGGGNQENAIYNSSVNAYDVVYENATLNESESPTATVATARSTVGSAATPLNINEDSVTEDSSISSTQAPTPSTDAPQVLPELTANLSEVEGSVGETVGVELNVSSFGGAGDDTFGSYSFVLSYNDQVLEFDSVEGGAWSDPYIVNEEENAVALADFDVSGSTPAAPALTFNFEIVDTGMSEISFDDSVAGIPAENTIYDESARAYSINFENGGAGTGGTPLDPTSFVSGHTITPSAAVDELPDYPVGDADRSALSDGVGISDASKIAEFVVGIPPEDPFDENLANVTREAPTGGTGVNIGDAQRIAQFVVNTSFAPQASLTAFAPTETITIGDSLTETVNVTNNGGMGTIQEVFYRIQDENGNDVFNESIDVVDLAIDGFEGNETDVTVAVTPDTSIDAGEYTQQIITKGIPPKSGIAIEDSSTTALTIEPDDPGSVSVVTQPQDTTAGETVEGPPAVNVTDQYGNPVPGETVEVSANGPDSVVGGPQTAVTNGSGIATFETLNITAAGSYTLTFDAENVSGTVDSESFEITSAEQASVTVETQPTDTTAGEIVGGLPAANVTDAFGNAVESVDVTVTSDAGIAEGQTTVATGADGIATFENLNITTAGTTTLTFAAGGVDENATTGEFEIAAAAVDSVGITPGAGQTVAAGEELAFSAEAFDEFGNLNESTNSAFNWDASDGSITGDGLFNTTVADESGTNYDVTAAIDGVSSAATTVTVEPAAVASVTISPASDKTITAGETVGFSATATDKFENVNESSDSAFSWDASGGSIAGDGLFEEASAAESGSDYDVTATLAGVSSAATTVTVNPAAVTSVEIAPASNQTVAAGEEIAFSATATDGFGNVNESDDSAFTWAGGSNISTTGLFNETNADKSGTDYDVTATLAGVSSAATTVTVEPGDVVAVGIDPDTTQTLDADAVDAGNLDFDVTAVDEFGNVVEDSDTAFDFGGPVDTSGVFQETTAGTYTVNATEPGSGVSSTDVSVEVTAGDAASVLVDAQPQDTTAGQIISGPPAAKVTDQHGNPVSGVDVTVSESGGYTFDSGTTTQQTGGNGVATFGDLVIETAGDYTLTFDAAGDSATTASFVVTAASANSVSVETQPQDTTAGTTIGGSPAAKVIDEFGNPVSGVDVSVSVNGGSLDSGTTPVPTDANGVATFGDLVIETAGSYSLEFSAASDAATTDSFTVTTAAANSVSVATQPSETTAGQTINGPPEAVVTDQYGNPVSGVDVSVSVNGGSLDGGTTPVSTDSNGVATFGDLVIETAGSYSLEFSAASDTATTASFTVTTAAGNSVSVETQPQDTTAGQSINGPPEVLVTDEFGNPVSGVDVSVSASGPGSIASGTTPVSTDGSGVATFSDLVIEMAGSYSLSFSAASDTATTASFTVTTAAANSVSVDTQPQDTTAGTTIGGSPTAVVTDEFGNPVSGVDVSVSVNGGSLDSGTTPVSTDGSGVATFGDLVIETAGSYSLEFSAASDTATTASFTVSAASANSVSVATQPSGTTAGNSINGPPEAKVTDEFGNPVSGVDVSVSVNGGSLDGGTTPVSTDGSGVATFGNLVIETAGSYSLDFSAAGDSATTASFTVSAASANSVSVTTQPSQTTAGNTISGPPAVVVTDQYENPVSGVDVTVSESSGYTFDSGTTTQETDGSGVATFGDLVIETAGDYTLTFDASGVSTTVDSSQFTVTTASANSVSVATQPQDTTAGTTIGGSPAAVVTDQYENPVSGVDVTVSANGPGSIASGTQTVSTDGSGVATFGDLVIETAGDYTLTFDASGVSTTVDSSQFAVTAASANSVSVDSQPSDTTAGQSIGGSPAAKVIDEFGNPVSGVDVSVSVNGGSLDGGTTPVSTDGSGVATFGNLVIETAGDYTLTFDASGVTATVDSSQFTVTAASANSVSVATQPSQTTAGNSINGPPEAVVTDEFGNPVSGASVSVSETGGYTFDSGTTTQQTDGSGVATFGDLVIETKGSYSLEFSAAGDSATTSSFSITAASVSTVTISPSSTTVEPGTSNAVDFAAEALDQYDNSITDIDSDFTWTATGGTVDGSGSYDSPSSSGTETVTAAYNSVSADATVTVQAPANFAVTITNAPDVVEGDDLSVEAFIENTGDVQDTQTITLDAGSLGTDSTSLTLGGGSSQTVTLSVGTSSGDAGSYNPTMSSDDASDSTSVSVNEPADFGVQITNAPDVVEGEDMSVEAYITNNGGVSDTQTITMSSNLGSDSQQITLGSGNSQFVTLSVGTGSGDAGSYNPTMSSEDDSASASVQVKEPADFSLSFSSLPGTITQGQNLDVSVQVSNNGDASGSTDVTVNPGDLGNSKTTSSGSVGAGGSTTVSFTFETTKNDGGRSYSVDASESTTGGSASGSVTVDQPIIDFTVRLQNDGDSTTGSTEVYVDESPNRYDDAVRVYGGGSGVVGHSFLYSATGVSAERLFGTQENDSAEGERPPERNEQNDSSEEDELSPGPGYPGLPDEPTSPSQLTEEEREELAEDRQEEDNQFDESNVQAVNPDDVEGNRITLEEPGVYSTDISDYDYVKIELEGPGGGASEAGNANTDENAGGDGGFVTAVWSVPYDNTVTTTVGDGGSEGDTYGDVGDGGSGYHDGGKGGYDDVFGGGTAAGGGGGGSTVAEIDGDVSAIAGGGGGGGAVNTGYTVVDSGAGGGGGGNDGSGGDGDGGSNDGESASSGNIGSSTYGGYGGDAYDGSSNTAYPGGDGGWAYYSAVSGTGSGSNGGGEDGGSPSENDGDDGSATVILPDISASGSAPNTVQPGESVTIGYTLSNSADVRGKEDDVDLYLDGSYEGDDGSVIVSANGDESGTLPSFTPNSEGYSGGDTINYEIDLDDFPSGDYTGTIDVAQPPPDPQVTNIRGPSSVEAGNTITFKIDIENFGGDMSSGENLDVDLDSDCCPPNEPGSPTLSAGESDTIYWDYDTSSSDTPEVVAWAGFGGVSAGDSGAESKSVTVNDPPDPQVTDIDANPSSGTPGDTVTFDITVENFGGDMSSSENIDIDLENAAGSIGYAGDVQLSGGQTTSVTEDYTLQSGDTPSFTAWSGVGNIQTGEGESVTVSVDDPAYFDVRIDSTNSPVAEGSTLNVDVEITNTGDVSDNQNIDLSIPGLGSDSTSVSLSGGQTKTRTLSVGTGGGDAGSYTAQASSDDDSYSQGVQVDEPAFFDVSIQSTNSPVEGNDLDVTVKVENTGDRSGTQTINLDVPGLGSDSTGVFLSGGNSKTRTLSVGTSGGDAGSYTAQVSSDDDSVSQNVQVKAPADLQVKSINFPNEIIAGNTLNIDVTVENTGDVSGSDTIELVIDGTVEDSIPVSVSGNSETTKTVSYEQTSSVVQALVDAGLVDIVDEEGEESNA